MKLVCGGCVHACPHPQRHVLAEVDAETGRIERVVTSGSGAPGQPEVAELTRPTVTADRGGKVYRVQCHHEACGAAYTVTPGELAAASREAAASRRDHLVVSTDVGHEVAE